MKVLISGANGYIGSKIAARLLASRACSVVALDKDPPVAHTRPKAETYEFFRADITRPESLRSGIASSEILIHCAALVHKRSADLSRSNYFNVNHQGTVNLLSALNPKKLKRVVFLSSVSVYGGRGGGVIPDEGTTPAPKDFYGESKLAAENEILRFGNTYGVPYTIFRLTPVYGRDFLININKRIYLPRKLAFYLISGGHQKVSLCSVNNVTDVISECIDRPEFSNETFILKDMSDYAFEQIVSMFKEFFVERRKPVFDIPAAFPATVFRVFAKLSPARGRYLLYTFGKVASDQLYSGAKLSDRGIHMRWDMQKTFGTG